MKINKKQFIQWLDKNNITYYWQYKYQDTPFVLEPELHVPKGTLDKYLEQFNQKSIMFAGMLMTEKEYDEVMRHLKQA